MNGRTRFAAALTAPLLVALLLAGCGIPTESTAKVIATDDTVTTVATPTTTPTPTANSVSVFFVDDDRLRELDRRVEQSPSLQVAVNELLRGPTKEEKAKDKTLLSSIPPDTALIGDVRVTGDVATVDLTEQFKQLSGDPYLKASAQIVYTVTANSTATKVRFEVDGEPTSPPTDKDGNQPQVGTANYRSLAP